ncbi:MAG: GGDEF domain-containing response regulator [Ktedonobacterales bacterium]
MDAASFEGPPPTILVVEDDPAIGRLLRATLEAEGFTTVVAPSGEEGISYAMREVPQLLILDIMLPGIDGFAVVDQLRGHAKTAHIPVVMLSAIHTPDAKMRAFASEVDDYLTKPFNTDELIARVRTQLRHVRESLLNPLTGLPSGLRVERAIEHQLKSSTPWSILYLDLDNFKAYNDVYGFLRGNDLIRLLAQVVRESVRDEGNLADFVGHIGGDDFVVITTPDRVDPLCRTLITRWEEESAAYYSADDQERGTFIAVDRQGQHQEYPLIGVSIGIVTNQHRPITTMEEVSTIAAEVKRKAKSVRGSSYYVDHRTGA